MKPVRTTVVVQCLLYLSCTLEPFWNLTVFQCSELRSIGRHDDVLKAASTPAQESTKAYLLHSSSKHKSHVPEGAGLPPHLTSNGQVQVGQMGYRDKEEKKR